MICGVCTSTSAISIVQQNDTKMYCDKCGSIISLSYNGVLLKLRKDHKDAVSELKVLKDEYLDSYDRLCEAFRKASCQFICFFCMGVLDILYMLHYLIQIQMDISQGKMHQYLDASVVDGLLLYYSHMIGGHTNEKDDGRTVDFS